MMILHNIEESRCCISAREIARATGIIISMGLALGPVARLFTRSLYALQNSVPFLSCKVCLSEDSLNEVQFWINNFSDLVGQPMWHSSPCIDVISYSDASSTGWGGYTVQLGQLVARGDWVEEDRRQSSTYRELKAWLCPGSEGVDSFTLDWRGENNWLVPPVHLISRVVRHMIYNKESGTLIVPHWPSAPWWPLFFRDDGTTQDFIVGCMDIPISAQTFLPGSAEGDLFGHGVPSCRILAIRIVCQ
ncbi:uncharacterized protein LOC114574912 [Exaiptasia diaphana]|uniref:Uncharacterized protein n=1 Tax=Exaiptasia diaphana TaxID=2652724 RepID=A0A913YIU3_EXADI|nr:uncharacterized protein LOC114574912 [Exaiptasia diaphana]